MYKKIRGKIYDPRAKQEWQDPWHWPRTINEQFINDLWTLTRSLPGWRWHKRLLDFIAQFLTIIWWLIDLNWLLCKMWTADYDSCVMLPVGSFCFANYEDVFCFLQSDRDRDTSFCQSLCILYDITWVSPRLEWIGCLWADGFIGGRIVGFPRRDSSQTTHHV